MTLRLTSPHRTPTLRLVTDNDTARLRPRFEHRYTASLVRVPYGLHDIADTLGVDIDRFRDMTDGTWQAQFEVPCGIWRVWPHCAMAVWVGQRRGVQLPGAAQHLLPVHTPVAGMLNRLAACGVRPKRLALRYPTGQWGPTMDVFDAHELLTDASRPAPAAMRGVLADADGQVGEVELHADGRAMAADRVSAERFLLIAAGLEGAHAGQPGDLSA